MIADDWVTVTIRETPFGWDVRLKEGKDSYMLVFIDLPREEMAQGFADRIKASLNDFAAAVAGEARP